MIDLPRRVSKPNWDMHGAGPVCGHQTVGGPAGSRDLGAGRLVTKVGGCDGSHTDHLMLNQRLCQHLLPRNHPDRRGTHRSVSPLRWASPVVPGPNPGDTHTHLSSDRGHGHALDHGDPGCVACQPSYRGAPPRRSVTPARCSRTATVRWSTPSSAPIRRSVQPAAYSSTARSTSTIKYPNSGESRQPVLATIVRGLPVQRYKRNRCQNLICGTDGSPVVGEES